MTIRAKLLWTLLGMSLLVALVGGFAISRQHKVAFLGATCGAEEVAAAVGYVYAMDLDPGHALTRRLVHTLSLKLRRDVEVISRDRDIVADAVLADEGGQARDLGGSLDKSLKDGRTRTFIETSSSYPKGIRQIAVPMKSASGQVLGAVIMEYTPHYEEILSITKFTRRQVVIASVASVGLALLLALYIGAAIACPLRQLTVAATGFAAGQSDFPMPAPRKDEIGALTLAFRTMVRRREHARDELIRARDELELRVGERTAEVALEREKYARLLDNIPATVFEHWPSTDGVNDFVSSHVGTMFGYTPKEWLVTPDFWASRIHLDDREAALKRVAALCDAGCGSERIECRWLARDDRLLWAETYLTVIPNPAGGMPGFADSRSTSPIRKRPGGNWKHCTRNSLKTPATSAWRTSPPTSSTMSATSSIA